MFLLPKQCRPCLRLFALVIGGGVGSAYRGVLLAWPFKILVYLSRSENVDTLNHLYHCKARSIYQ